MKKMTDKQIEACGKAMPKILKEFRDIVVGQTFRGRFQVPANGEYPACTGVILSSKHHTEVAVLPQLDDEGNPGPVDLSFRGKYPEKENRTITDAGYFSDHTPFIEVGGTMYVLPDHGGGRSRPSVLFAADCSKEKCERQEMLCQIR